MKLLVTAAAFLIGATFAGSAHAAVTGPVSAMQSASQSIGITEQTRRICESRLRCKSPFNCKREQVCYITRDYPPEHGRSRR
jgi:hypothetical protein